MTWAPWDVAMMLRPATVFMPTGPDSAFPRGVRTFDNEGVSTSVRDEVVGFVDDIAVVSCRDAVSFKYGVDAAVGRIFPRREACVMRKVSFAVDVSASGERQERRVIVNTTRFD